MVCLLLFRLIIFPNALEVCFFMDGKNDRKKRVSAACVPCRIISLSYFVDDNMY